MNKKVPQFTLTAHQKEQYDEVLNVAGICQYEKEHTDQVTNLAISIFDQLQPLTGLDEQARFYLLCAATLHDIGVHTEGAQGHHKTALRIILSTPLLHFNSQERLLIGSIARYHRKALPSSHHSHFAALSKPAQKLVVQLSAILRVADGLDYRHKALVQKVKLKISNEKLTFFCTSKYNIDKEITSASHKSDLMHTTFNRKVIFKEN